MNTLINYMTLDSNVDDFLASMGIETIGDDDLDEIPDTWRYVKLDKLVSIPIKRGKTPKYVSKSSVYVFAQKCNQKDGTVSLDKAKFLDESLLKKYEDEDFLFPNDIVINSTGDGTLGRIGYIECEIIENKRVVPDTHITVVRLKNGVLPQYIFAYLRKNQSYLESKGVGSTKQTELRPDTIKNLIIPIPPIEEQQRIVDKLNEALFAVEN